MISSQFKVGGSLQNDDPTYVVRRSDYQLYTSLKAGEFCYVFNSRQMGKSSMLVRAKHQLEKEGYLCTHVDMTRIGSRHITPLQWYKGVVGDLWRGMGCVGKINLKTWWQEKEEISLPQKLSEFIEELLFNQFPEQKLCIFIDEIDSILSLEFPVDDFFALIRYCYNQRSLNREYNRISFALFGVATPSDLIRDKTRTPFNIGTAIDLYGFSSEEALPLALGFVGKFERPHNILKEILAWSGGQPFLTQKLCQLVDWAVQEKHTLTIPPGTEEYWVESIVRQHVIENWESVDEPEHLKTIRDRLLYNENRAGRLLSIYQQILQGVQVPVDDTTEQIELLLSGIVEKHNGYLRIKNPIYQNVFNPDWVLKQLDNLRPYSQSLNAWVASGYLDESRLLRGQALREVIEWTSGKNLGDLDYQFLTASQELEHREVEQKLEAERLKEIEARLKIERLSARRQRQLLVWVSLALVAAIVLGIATLSAYQQSAISEVRALVSASNGSFNSNQHLDSLVQAIEARQKFQKLNLLARASQRALDSQTRVVLEQAVYGADEVNRLSGHEGGALDVDLSKNGQWIASSGTDRTVRLWKRDGTLVRTLHHDATLYSVKFSPDSQRIVASGLDGVVRLWATDGTPLATLKGHSAAVWGVAFSPDGQTIASASSDRTIKLWRTDGTLIKTLEGHKAAVWSVAFSPDGEILASCSLDNTIKLWNRDGTEIRTIQNGSAAVRTLAFSPDGQTLVSGGSDKLVKLWSRKGELLLTLEGHTGEISQVVFSNDGLLIASASADKTVKLWRRDGSLLRTLRGHRVTVRSVAISPQGSTIASASEDGIIKLWKISPFQQPLHGHRDVVWRVAYAKDMLDSQSLLATVAGQEIKLWRWDGSAIKTIPISTNELNSAAFSPIYRSSSKENQQILAVAGASGKIYLLNLANGKTDILSSHNGPIFGLAFSPDGRFLVSAADDRTIKLWQRDAFGQFKLIQDIIAHSTRIWDIAFSPNPPTPPTQRQTPTEGNPPAALAPLNKGGEGGFIASASVDSTVKLWTWKDANHQTLLPYKTLKGHKSAVWGVAISPDSQRIVSAGRDGQLLLWNRDGKLVQVIKGGKIGLTRVAFSPGGKLIAAGSLDNTIKIWSLDGTLLTTLSGHISSVESVAFSPDGKTLASGSDDQTAILWNLEQILDLNLLKYGCDLVRDYLNTNSEVNSGETPGLLRDRQLCS
ncbi:WD40 repeat domain-containing protein [Iningainema tapete]|uniref:AAA-like domain-containing protein n=1 Tax=Iningainema tapete BLCC-T55 TaxID=2748662 RepID=A0A8J6XIZ5_9CYAN|nr:WD40 repeat domain-containing protein [Iningainema tapete]MBD2777740.1 AAA-like domain-containing protein [Iningainema tapete BLCC-T55]